RALRGGLPGRALDARIVGAEAILAMLAVDQRVGEPRHVPRGFPNLRVHEDRRVETFDVLALVDHRTPPALLDVLLELDAQRPVVPHRAKPAVDLGRLKHAVEY